MRDVAVVETLFATGLRTSEGCGLRSKDISLESGNLFVKGKGKKIIFCESLWNA